MHKTLDMGSKLARKYFWLGGCAGIRGPGHTHLPSQPRIGQVALMGLGWALSGTFWSDKSRGQAQIQGGEKYIPPRGAQSCTVTLQRALIQGWKE